MPRPTASYIRARLSYNPANGVFTWLARRDGNPRTPAWNTRWAGKPAGNADRSGRVQIRLDTTKYEATHLAWVAMTGEWPADEIDHIDCDPGNNAWANLRAASRSENMRNTRLSSRNTTGFKGVCFDRSRQKWMATIKVGGKLRNLGRFSNAEDAASAYRRAALEAFGEFARLV